MPRKPFIAAGLILAGGLALLLSPRDRATGPPAPPHPSRSAERPPPPPETLPGDALLAGYADPDSPPIDDLRKLQHVLSGYFSVIKDLSRHPIGGNADLSAALLGENIDRQPFIAADHPVFNPDGLLSDRWGTPLSVHPEAARELTLRSAGPDRTHFTPDDLVLRPDGSIAPPD